MTDAEYMREAVSLAKQGLGFVNPNPLVGAIIVKNGRIIGRGAHLKYGQLHAERNAFAACTEDCTGADMYVTLEPCCHYGKNPPCTEAVIEHGIKRVFVGSADPNPLVAGKGVAMLREHGIEVIENFLRDECDALNEIFFHYITKNLPFVTMKYAMTMDGKIAAYTGRSKWITSEAARADSQTDRLKHAAIMVGMGTVLADDPMLTCRLENGRDPIRIICDTSLRTPLDSAIVTTANKVPTIIATCCDSAPRLAEYEKLGCRIISCEMQNGHVSLPYLMEVLGSMKIDSILLEGGGELNWSALQSGIVNKVKAYIAPKIFGGAEAKSPVSGMGVPSPDSAFRLADTAVKRIGCDILLESRVISDVHGNY